MQNKEPYLRANIRSYLLTKRRKKLENKRIYFRTKQKQNRDIKPRKGTIERTRKFKNKQTLEYVQLRK